jgi:alkylation response protein AidB-like acyl-CoA dehydrogenase
MSWVLDETKSMLRDSVQTFLRERAPVAQLRTLRDTADARGHDPALWLAFAEQGYCATLIPEPQGGLGLGVVEAGLIAEEMGHTLAAAPYLSTAVLAAWLLARAGSPALQFAWLPRIAAGQAVLALAVDEHARHRPDALATRAEHSAGHWCVDGNKCLVVDGHVADALIVAARAPQGVVLLLVPADAPGLTVERTLMVDAHNAARVRLDGVRVPESALIGEPQPEGALLHAVLNVGRAVVAAEMLGVADEAFTRTLQYLKERRQFDHLIGEFQALQHRAAELWCDLELTRAIVRQALQELDQGAATAPLRVAQAKARAALTVNRAVQEAVQMHGGIGMTDELEIGFFMKRARVLQTLFGDAAYHLDRAALLSRY